MSRIKMKVKIDKNKCIGCGICTDICPDGIEIKKGKARIKNENAECIEKAAESCPNGAIILKDRLTEKEMKEKDVSFERRPIQDQSRTQDVGTAGGSGFPRGQGRGIGRGRGGKGRMGGFAAGPGGECRCPNCGHREPHQRGEPCNTKKCPKCGAPMTRA